MNYESAHCTEMQSNGDQWRLMNYYDVWRFVQVFARPKNLAFICIGPIHWHVGVQDYGIAATSVIWLILATPT